MALNIFTLFIFYKLILFSVIGFGLFFGKLIFKNNLTKDLGILGFIGLFFLTIYSYYSHLIIPHDYSHNVILLIIGLSLLCFFFKSLDLTSLKILFINFSFLFITLLLFKTHDDFHYYHFPYSYYITQHPLLVGVGQFNHGFRTPSSIFYLNSLFFFPLAKYYLFYIPTLLIMGFSNQTIVTKILEYLKKKKVDFIFFLLILFFTFINIFFYRLQEHGTDRSAQILILILFTQLVIFFEFGKNLKDQLKYMLLILGLIISLKAFYILYSIFPLVVIWAMYKEKKLYLIVDVLRDKVFYFFLSLIFIILLTNFFNTGCIVYPIHQTCFESFDWSLGSIEAIRMNEHYHLWSKGGHTPNFLVDNPKIYLQNFNWVENWIGIYFFNKVSDLILGLLFTSFVLILIFYKKNQSKFLFNKNSIILMSVVFLLLAEWFINHPSLRYGGYALFAILFFAPTSIILQKFKNNFHEIHKKVSIFFCIVLIIFLSRNYIRMNDEVIKYGYTPLKNPSYKVEDKHLRVEKQFSELIENFENCQKSMINCNQNDKTKVKKFLNNRYIFVVNK